MVYRLRQTWAYREIDSTGAIGNKEVIGDGNGPAAKLDWINPYWGDDHQPI